METKKLVAYGQEGKCKPTYLPESYYRPMDLVIIFGTKYLIRIALYKIHATLMITHRHGRGNAHKAP